MVKLKQFEKSVFGKGVRQLLGRLENYFSINLKLHKGDVFLVPIQIWLLCDDPVTWALIGYVFELNQSWLSFCHLGLEAKVK